MKRVFSKITPDLLIYSLIKKEEINSYRQDMSPECEYLQGSARILNKDLIVSKHKHDLNKRNILYTQESWVIIEGKIKSIIFDVDSNFLNEEILEPGDCIILYRGGHELQVLEENTIFYEFKTGPYIKDDKIKL